MSEFSPLKTGRGQLEIEFSGELKGIESNRTVERVADGGK